MKRPLDPVMVASSKEQGGSSSSSFVVVDASVWVSRLVPQDVFHTTVKTWMKERRADGVMFLSPALLLPEVSGAISRRTGEPQLARNAIDGLMRLPGLKLVELDQQLVREAAKLAADLGLRGADSFYVAVAVQLDLQLVTLDVDQESRAASVIAVYSLEK